MLRSCRPRSRTYAVTRRLFLRLLGAVYFIAFASLAAQIAGLAGERGITPRFVRAVLYDYRFSTAEERRRTGAWWVRELEGEYSAGYVALTKRRLRVGGRT